MNNSLIIFGLGIFFTSAVLVYLFTRLGIRKLLDIPNARSAHWESIPRGAGSIFVLLWIFSLWFGYHSGWLPFREFQLFSAGTAMISLLGFWDDFHQLNFKIRLMAQIIISIGTLFLIGNISGFHFMGATPVYLGWGALLLALLGLVWSTNAFNFMDGLDGFTGLEAIFVLGVGGLLFWLQGEAKTASLLWMMVAGVSGFLIWNWPKAKVFMGDAGSYCLGFTIALFAIVGDAWYGIPVILWVILYGIFWFDATVTLFRRFLRRENLAVAHREHAYQRLHRSGFLPRHILMWTFAVNSLLAGIALGLYFNPQWFIWGMSATIVLLGTLYWVIETIQPMRKNK